MVGHKSMCQAKVAGKDLRDPFVPVRIRRTNLTLPLRSRIFMRFKCDSAFGLGSSEEERRTAVSARPAVRKRIFGLCETGLFDENDLEGEAPGKPPGLISCRVGLAEVFVPSGRDSEKTQRAPRFAPGVPLTRCPNRDAFAYPA